MLELEEGSLRWLQHCLQQRRPQHQVRPSHKPSLCWTVVATRHKLYQGWEGMAWRLDKGGHLVNLIFFFFFFNLGFTVVNGGFWWSSPLMWLWDGNPMFYGDYNAYLNSLKSRSKHTNTSMHALPMLLKDLKTSITYLDGDSCLKNMPKTKQLYFQAFTTTSFTLWTWYVVPFSISYIMYRARQPVGQTPLDKPSFPNGTSLLNSYLCSKKQIIVS